MESPSMQDRLEKVMMDKAAELFASMQAPPDIFDRRRWFGQVIAAVMEHEDFKVRFLRFLDVLPALKTDSLVLRLFREYFEGVDAAPRIIRYGIERLSRKGMIPRISASLIRSAVASLAGLFIAGRNPGYALSSLESFRIDGAFLSVDLLGEEVLSDSEAQRYAERYLDCLKFLAPRFAADPVSDRTGVPFLDISLKVSSLYSQTDPLNWDGSIEKTKTALRPLFHMAGALNASITFDMEHYYHKDLTITLFKQLLEEFWDFPNAGIALQSYLRDTKEDLTGLLRWAKERERRITVRLVKGAYWDYEIVVNRQKGWPVPVFLDKDETDRNFEELTRALLENTNIVYPAIATHNIRSICHAIAVAEDLKLSERDYEFQTLYGMGEPVRKALRGRPVRVYCPVGELIPGMAYLARRILENISTGSFLRKTFAEKKSFEELMRPPQPPKSSEAEVRKGFRNQPATDFSKHENRREMEKALAGDRHQFGRRCPLWIGGKEIFTGHEYISTNPARPDELIGWISAASREQAEIAVMEAKSAQGAWALTPPEERADFLFRAAGEMRKRRFDLAALEVREVGKTIMEADADVAEAIDYLEYYALLMTDLAKPRRLGRYPGELNIYGYEPRGIAVVISPWNFPLAIPTGMASAAIVTGNCAILKPSGLSPVTAWQLVDVFRSVGLPPGVLQYLPGSGAEVGEHLAAHAGIDLIAFTGSKDVGLRLVKLSGDTLPGQAGVKRVIAEMGGKNAIIVDDTADLDEAVRGALESCFSYQGQKCSACSRLIVLEGVLDEFCGRLIEAMKSIVIGPPEDPATFLGPLIDGNAFHRVQGYLRKGGEEGKTLFVRRACSEGNYVGPALFEVAPEASLAQDEIFGPVVAVMRATDIDDAIAIANRTAYALTGGIYSRSPANILKAENEFRAGNLYINRKITGALVGRQPFGGLGMSGIGSKAGGPDYLLQFMNPRTISENTLRKGFASGHPDGQPNAGSYD